MNGAEQKILRVVITDDHKIVRDGITALFQDQGLIKIVGEASNGSELLDMLTKIHADVVLLDMNMPGKSGLEITEELKQAYPDTKVLILSMLDHESYVKKAMDLGADGYLLKNAGKEELQSAIQLVASGAPYISPSISLNLLQAGTLHDTSDMATQATNNLSKREMEVLHLIAEGFTNSEIAEKLFNSKRTIETHRQNLLEKTKCKNTASLIKYAVLNGLI
ncbi:response regulator [Pontibacter beigongshangensis]|uniref:response regulator n=1 Tax=Pontibacter beigongshangensis TaxID=2574733 RepID=UPI0018880472|nr:response regulator transcription factor [Pontibacter beigongshangensis]